MTRNRKHPRPADDGDVVEVDGSEFARITAQPQGKRRQSQRLIRAPVPDELDAGEVADKSSSGNSPTDHTAAEPSPTGTPNWNRAGNTPSTRTTFGAPAPAVPPKGATVSFGQGQAEAEAERMDSFEFKGLWWKLPSRRMASDYNGTDPAACNQAYEEWCQSFLAVNSGEKNKSYLCSTHKSLPLFFEQTYMRWFGTCTGRKFALKAAKRYKVQIEYPKLIGRLYENIAKGEPPSALLSWKGSGSQEISPAGSSNVSISQNGDSEPIMPPEGPAAEMAREKTLANKRRRRERKQAQMATEMAAKEVVAEEQAPKEMRVPEDQLEIEGELKAQEDGEVNDPAIVRDMLLRKKYFPGIQAGTLFCTLCTGRGHQFDGCPERLCRFCSSIHISTSCPARNRCSKCKQLGHPSSECQEKLSLTPGEVIMECAFCASTDHTEAICNVFCRSYRKYEGFYCKVKHIPIFCYCCGAGGHYGEECGLNQMSRERGGVATWSKTNWEQYVDADSTEDPIAGAAFVGQTADRPDFGKSIVPQRHVFFEAEEDDEDEGFLRARVQKNAPNGHITFNQVLPPAPGLPPLPPGPPPPMPPGLPARPPPAPKYKKKQRPGSGNGQRGGFSSLRRGRGRGGGRGGWAR